MARHRFERKRKPRTVYLWVLILILLASTVWGVSAKYVRQQEEEQLVQAKMFYFTSDLLKEGGASYTLNPGTTKVEFTLNNFADDLRFSEDPIQYTYTINGTESTEAQLNETNKTDTIEFNVQAGGTYEVSATGIAGYAKTLSATFKVLKAPANIYKHLAPDTSGDHFVLLTVWTEDVSGDVTVSFPDGLIPDETDPKLQGIVNYSGGGYGGKTTASIEMKENNSMTFRFFKEDPTTVYSAGQFGVTLKKATGETQTATIGDPDL